MAKKKAKVKAKSKKSRGGRPTKHTKDIDRQAELLSEKGFTDAEMAAMFKVTEQTVNNWKKIYPGFFESLKKGKDIADQKVVMSLYNRACGYSHPEVYFTSYLGTVTKTAHIKHYPPEVVACIFWLKNRQPELWRDKTETEVEVKYPAPLSIKQAENLLKKLKKSSDGVDYGRSNPK